jgi:hypothetical protein
MAMGARIIRIEFPASLPKVRWVMEVAFRWETKTRAAFIFDFCVVENRTPG